ncbi:MAG: hypothetical protein D6814_04825 [Calditrichaeota bacterium]|nr:MAG: hypothetical protein D6814_04825 [Calditrichota bacterium]
MESAINYNDSKDNTLSRKKMNRSNRLKIHAGCCTVGAKVRKKEFREGRSAREKNFGSEEPSQIPQEDSNFQNWPRNAPDSMVGQ